VKRANDIEKGGRMAIKDQFHCYGHFYNIFQAGQKVAECRSVLEIVRKTANITIRNASHLIPDAVVIMMNPGTSYSLDTVPERMDLETFEIDFENKRLVTAHPDATQPRIMKLMNFKNWKHVRILNLTDIREGDSNRLGALMEAVEQITNTSVHSIFSDRRWRERKSALTEDNVPILLAWGSVECISEYAEKCLVEVCSRKILGVPSTQSELYFQHPLTRRISWYNNMIELLEGAQ
jgi:hypothetical protein